MRLRTLGLIGILALGILGPQLAADAQQVGKVWQIGILGNVPAHTWDAFRQALRQLGYVEGQNIVVEPRWSEGRPERFPGLAAELVRLKVDVIVATSTPGVQAAKNATQTIPIVIASAADPVGTGLIASLARPGGNITGLSILADFETRGKLLEILKEAVPKVSRVAVLWNSTSSIEVRSLDAMQAPARALGLALRPVEARSPDEFDGAFAVMTREGADALIVMDSGLNITYRAIIVDLAAKHRLPAMYGFREFVEAGGLVSYGVNLSENYRRAAVYVDKILKGAKPADLPVEQPTRFELFINLKTAKALGLTIPQSVLIRADEVIQ